MAFFVLLLSFSTMDAIRFKRMADSLKDAFGVQRDVPAYEIPTGVSVIVQHFSPAPTEPTPLEEVKQSVTHQLTRTQSSTDSLKGLMLQVNELKKLIIQAKKAEIEAEADKIRTLLKDEINNGLVSIETKALKIIIRIHEKGSFLSGSAVLKAGFEPVLLKISEAIKQTKGKVVIGGHTDNIPIATDWYRSNWELSASRAVTVAQHILQKDGVAPVRIEVIGHADTIPLVPNTSPKNRAKNRRVEIVLVQNDLHSSD